MSTTLATIGKLLVKLAKEDPNLLRQVKDRCDYLLGNNSNPEAFTGKLIKPVATDWYAPAVRRYAIRRGWATKDTVHILMSQKALAHLPLYNAESAAMRKHVEDALQVFLRGVQLDALGNVIVEAVANHYAEINKFRATKGQEPITVNMRLLLAVVRHVPEILDKQLPGYLNSGMLSLVVKMKG